jgi:hypothetical protein
MRSILRRLAEFTGLSRARSAICQFCGVNWPQSSPFVEGRSGILICRSCLAAAKSRSDLECHAFSSSILVDDPSSTHLDTTPNPYIAPAVDFSCFLCGRSTQGQEALTIAPPHVACRDCLGIAVQLVADYESKSAIAGSSSAGVAISKTSNEAANA